MNTITTSANFYRDGLLDDILPFWIKHSVDHEHGGFMMALNRDGSVIDTDKGVWQQGRFTWLLGELYNNIESLTDDQAVIDRKPEWLELALHGAKFMDDHCFDSSDGRMWFQITREGKPIRKRRYAFGESFAAIAYGELAKATGDSKYADRARDCFDRFVQHNLNPTGVEPKFTDIRPTRGIGFPMITINTAQELRESIQLDSANDWIDRSIDDIRQFHVKDDIECVMETVGANGELISHFDGRMLNPGHAIEGAWFIMAEGRHREDAELVSLGRNMLDWMWNRGWDREYGGLLYYTSVDGKPVQEYYHDMKFWWPHNETIIASLMAFHLTGAPRYAQMHQQVHDWAHQYFPDPEFGEWFGYLRRDGSVNNESKGNIWKGPFHLPRMQLKCWDLLRDL